jgi:hypothetical protein
MRAVTECALLALGERLCPSDYAVQHYMDPQHPKFFGKAGLLLTAVLRGAAHRPKKERGPYLAEIEAIILREKTLVPNFRDHSELVQQVSDGEEQLIAAVRALPENLLEKLILDAAAAYDDQFFGCEESDLWLEDFKFQLLPDDPEDLAETDYTMRKTVPSIRDFLATELRGKSRHSTIAWLSRGIIELIAPLKGRGLDPFLYYHQLAAYVEGLLSGNAATR